MAVQFILGRSGTGKTRFCIDAITASLLKPQGTHPLILLVPEQATYQAERAILAAKGISGYSRLHVLSFSRLEFMLRGRYNTGNELSRIAQQLVIHRILRKKSESLKIFSGSAKHPGLAAQLARTIVELHQYNQTPHELTELAEKLYGENRDSLVSLKFADIAAIYSEYLKFVDSGFLNPDIQLSNACKAVSNAPFLKDARLWVDGFSGFTDQELAMLRELLKRASQSNIALCLDPSTLDFADPPQSLDQLSIFGPTERTWVSLIEIINKNNLHLEKPEVLKKSLRFAVPQISHIEQNLFKDDPQKIESGKAVQLIAAANARAEAEYVARQIVSLVRDRKWRFRDIAVVASDLGGYRHYIQAAFDDCDIPFFLDMAKPVTQHPVIELILSSLSVVINGFKSIDIFAFLKTDLGPLTRDETDLLENYCLAYGIDDARWKQKLAWNFAQNDANFIEERIDQLRKKAASPLLEFENKFPDLNTITAAQFRKAVDEFFQSLNVNDKIAMWPENSDEHRQFITQLSQLFAELSQIFGNDAMPLEDFAALLTRAFEQMSLRLIPPSLDQVLVGSIERSRHPDLKAIFLLGASQKQFPIPVRFESILTDDDRTAAESAGVRLSENTAVQLAQRQYLVYIAYTRPSDFLFVSYPAADNDGSVLPPSSFVANLQSLFTDLTPRFVGHESRNISECTGIRELTDVLCQKLGADNGDSDADSAAGMLSRIMAENELAPAAKAVVAAFSYRNQAAIEKDFISVDARIFASATRLSCFASCPYQYFAKHVLKLKERQIYSFEPPDLGEFYHKVLCDLFERLRKEGLRYASVAQTRLLSIVNETVADVISGNTFYSGFISRSLINRHIIDSAIDVLRDLIIQIAQMAKAGQFRQLAAELKFSFPIQLSENRTLVLNGTIDRIDVDSNGKAIIFDYKKSMKSFSWAKFYNGFDLQLALYMLAISSMKINGKTLTPQGAFYLPIEIGADKIELDQIDSESAGSDRKAKGVFNGEIAGILDSGSCSGRNRFYNFGYSKNDGPYGYYGSSGALKAQDFRNMLSFARSKILELADRISSGEIAISPYRLGAEAACTNCKAKPLCRFDWRINSFNYLQSAGKIAVLEKIGDAHE